MIKALSLIIFVAGFVTTVNGAAIAVGWTRLYQCAFPVGFGLSFVTFWAFSTVFPPAGNGIAEPFELQGGVYDGVTKANLSLADIDSKEPDPTQHFAVQEKQLKDEEAAVITQ